MLFSPSREGIDSFGLLNVHGGSLSELSTTPALDTLASLRDDLILGLQEELDVAGGSHEVLGPTVSTETTPAASRSTVHLNVRDVEVVHIQILHLRVGLCVLEEVQEETAGLLRPAGVRAFVALTLGMVTRSTSVNSEGDSVLLRDDILEVLPGTLEAEALDRLCGWEKRRDDQHSGGGGEENEGRTHRSGLTSVLVVNTEVRATSPSGPTGGNDGIKWRDEWMDGWMGGREGRKTRRIADRQ